MASPCLFLFSLLYLFSFLPFSCSSQPNTITLSLSVPFAKTPYKNPWQRLNHLTSSSLDRAHRLKHPHITKTPLFPHSYGGYSISLSFGSPPQTLNFVMDTGSSLVWFPCTHRYVCTQCNFPNVDPRNISTFIPKFSSSSKILGCKTPKCGLVYGPDIHSRCQDCDHTSGNCTQNCPAYLIQYGSGITSGILLSETLVFPNRDVKDFVVGCSIFSGGQPAGIAGFGRGPESLPAQMGLRKFSYCLVSHQFDDTPESSELVLEVRSVSGNETAGIVSYTPFRKNPLTSNSAFQDYYYVTLRKITVGGVQVKVPYKLLVPESDGNGGTIVDSGTTFTYLDREVFELVAREFEKQMAHYSRASDVETQSGLRPCYDISSENSVLFPDLIFHFKGGAKMALPLADYFSIVGDSGVVCMTVVSNNVVSPGVNSSGPSIIIGNYQQQNFYLEYDLEKERLGFRKEICK